MRTAEEMYYFAKNNGFGRGFTEKLGVKHFQIIADNLQADEDVKMVFIGLHNYKSISKHDNNYAYAVTNKRIIMAQKKIIGTVCQSVFMNQLNDITMETGVAFGIVTIDTTKERFNVAIAKNEAQNVFTLLHSVIDDLKHPEKTQQNAAASAMSALQYFKQMYDAGLITQQEFEAKKRQVLGL